LLIDLVGFNLYDVNKDGIITKQEMANMLKAIASMMIGSEEKYTSRGLDKFIHNFVATTFFLYNRDQSKEGLTFEEFENAAMKDEEIAQFFTLDILNKWKIPNS
jgi:Ca2+-binding EF-hand superfamily protein